jgi:hypothetical protein
VFISISLINFSHQVSVVVAIFLSQNTKINRKKQKGKMKIKRSKA